MAVARDVSQVWDGGAGTDCKTCLRKESYRYLVFLGSSFGQYIARCLSNLHAVRAFLL